MGVCFEIQWVSDQKNDLLKNDPQHHGHLVQSISINTHQVSYAAGGMVCKTKGKIMENMLIYFILFGGIIYLMGAIYGTVIELIKVFHTIIKTNRKG